MITIQPSLCCYLCAARHTRPGIICDPCWEDLMFMQERCHRCGGSVNYKNLCAACIETCRPIEQTLTLGQYRFPFDKLLLSLKYNKQLVLAQEFGHKIAEQVMQTKFPLPDYLVPVPLHPRRLMDRGYNQALEICRPISERLSVPIMSWGVLRRKNTLPQFELQAKQRRENVRGAFKLACKPLSGRFVIVDDIVTTGETANELARQLKRHGASQVGLWACAHAG